MNRSKEHASIKIQRKVSSHKAYKPTCLGHLSSGADTLEGSEWLSAPDELKTAPLVDDSVLTFFVTADLQKNLKKTKQNKTKTVKKNKKTKQNKKKKGGHKISKLFPQVIVDL